MIGVIADDTTGANDIGIMFSNNNYTVKILTYKEDLKPERDCDVLIIDTDSRLDPPEVSYDKVYRSAKILQELGCSLYYNKTCSVFRGNIGKEFDAMMDALEEDFSVVTLAFPKNGRKTLHGIHTVHGKLLEESEFARDPVHPMKQSNLITILEEQTDRKVSHVDIDIVRKGAAALRKAIVKLRKTSNYCIIDSETQEDLNIVAEAIHNFKVLGGSSAIAEELPKFLPKTTTANDFKKINMSDENGVLIVSGSLTPQTKAQTAHLISTGTFVIVLDSRRIFTTLGYKEEVARAAKTATAIIKTGKDVLVMADNKDEIVFQTKTIGKERNMHPLEVSKLVSAALADITDYIIGKTGLKRLVVAGGDTSGTVCRKLGIEGNYVLKEIETGLPSGLAIGRNLLIVLKSGSFGNTEFLQRAVNHLKEISEQLN